MPAEAAIAKPPAEPVRSVGPLLSKGAPSKAASGEGAMFALLLDLVGGGDGDDHAPAQSSNKSAVPAKLAGRNDETDKSDADAAACAVPAEIASNIVVPPPVPVPVQGQTGSTSQPTAPNSAAANAPPTPGPIADGAPAQPLFAQPDSARGAKPDPTVAAAASPTGLAAYAPSSTASATPQPQANAVPQDAAASATVMATAAAQLPTGADAVAETPAAQPQVKAAVGVRPVTGKAATAARADATPSAAASTDASSFRVALAGAGDGADAGSLASGEGESEPAPASGDVAAAPEADAPASGTPATPGQPAATAQTSAPGAPVQAGAGTAAQLAAQIVRRLDGRTSRFDVQLDPLGLGGVRVSVEIDSRGRLSAALAFEHPESARALQAHAQVLQAALERAGFDLSGGGLSFETADRGGSGQKDAAASARPALFDTLTEAAADADRGLAVIGRKLRGLDIRI